MKELDKFCPPLPEFSPLGPPIMVEESSTPKSMLWLKKELSFAGDLNSELALATVGAY